jgi:hypothetical protein
MPTSASAVAAAPPSDPTGGMPLPPAIEAIQRDYAALLRSEAARRWIGVAYEPGSTQALRPEMPAEIIAAAHLARQLEALIGTMSDEANRALTADGEPMVKKRIR